MQRFCGLPRITPRQQPLASSHFQNGQQLHLNKLAQEYHYVLALLQVLIALRVIMLGTACHDEMNVSPPRGDFGSGGGVVLLNLHKLLTTATTPEGLAGYLIAKQQIYRVQNENCKPFPWEPSIKLHRKNVDLRLKLLGVLHKKRDCVSVWLIFVRGKKDEFRPRGDVGLATFKIEPPESGLETGLRGYNCINTDIVTVRT